MLYEILNLGQVKNIIDDTWRSVNIDGNKRTRRRSGIYRNIYIYIARQWYFPRHCPQVNSY